MDGQVRAGLSAQKSARAGLGAVGFAILALAGLTACSDSSGPDTDSLSQAEAAQLLTALSAAYLPTPSLPAPTSAAGPPTVAPMRVPETTVEVDSARTTIGCAAGGSVVVESRDSTTTTVDVVLNPTPERSYETSSDYSGRARVTTSYLECASRDAEGRVWTFDAEPGLTLTYDLTGETAAVGFTSGGYTSSSRIDWEGIWDGTLGWTHDGRSGTCGISIVTESRSTIADGASTYSFSQTGSICGVSVTSSSSSPT